MKSEHWQLGEVWESRPKKHPDCTANATEKVVPNLASMQVPKTFKDFCLDKQVHV